MVATAKKLFLYKDTWQQQQKELLLYEDTWLQQLKSYFCMKIYDYNSKKVIGGEIRW